MNSQEPGEIFTFYSYKGGTGRTMALANIGCLLAQRREAQPNGVLAVDWDLEAPGLHWYLREYIPEDIVLRPGLIDLFLALQSELGSRKLPAELTPELREELEGRICFDEYVIKTTIPGVQFLKAGRFDGDYASRVNTFPWEPLYHRAPWLIPLLGDWMSTRFHYVLVDSRTGITDTSGICTMLLPDKLVLVFTPNRQSLEGAIEVARRASTYRRKSSDIRELSVFPLPCRIERSEPAEIELWRQGTQENPGYQKRFEALFREVWGIAECNLEAYFDEVMIQHDSSYAYGEKIAVLRETSDNRISLKRSFVTFTEKLATLTDAWEQPGGPGSRAAQALGAKAQLLLARLKPDEQAAARRLLTRLVRWPEGATRPVPREIDTVLMPPPEAALIPRFVEPRFLTLGREASGGRELVRLAEERLLTDWWQLSQWLAEDREFLQWRDRLDSARLSWEASNREPTGLLRGMQLTTALSWLKNREADFDDGQRSFIQASVVNEEQSARAARDRSQGLILQLMGAARAKTESADFKAASSLLSSAVAMAKQDLGEDHPDTLLAMDSLAASLTAQGDLAGARRFREQVLEARRRALGEGHPGTLAAMSNLAASLYAQGDLQGARRLLEQVLETHRRALGEEHPDTLAAMRDLAETLRSLGNLEEARLLQQQVQMVSARVLGEAHPDTLQAMGSLALTLATGGDYGGARALLKRVLAISMPGPGETLAAQGDYAHARALVERLSALSARVLGERRPDTSGAAWLLHRMLITDELRGPGELTGELPAAPDAESAAAGAAPGIVVDSSGPGLAAALRSAPPGARILLKGPAEYRESLILDKPVEIIGEGEVRLIGVGGPAITSTGAAVRITRLKITAEGFNGVVICGGYCVLDQAEVSGTRYSGVLVRDGAEALLIRCSMQHAEHCGLHAQLGSKCMVVGSTIHENGTGGLFFSQGAEGLAESNLIERNGLNGIYIAAAANPRIARNRIRDHSCAGVLVYRHNEWRDHYGPGRGVLEDNEITDGRQFGIQIEERADPCVRRNVIKGNAWGGIWTRERGRGTICENLIADNVGSGVKNEGGRPLIGRNVFSGNGGQPIEDYGSASLLDSVTCRALKNVLWVDDRPENNDDLIDHYRPLGIRFDLALSTPQALDCLAQGEYALIISDIGRGDNWKAGIDMIPEIHNRFPSAPPIIIYAHVNAVGAYSSTAMGLGASLVTASPRELELRLEKILT